MTSNDHHKARSVHHMVVENIRWIFTSSVSCVIDISTVARLCARDRTPEGRVFVGSGGGLPIGLLLKEKIKWH